MIQLLLIGGIHIAEHNSRPVLPLKEFKVIIFVTRKFFYDQNVCYRFGVQKKRFAKNSELREPRNLLFSYALTVTKRQFG